MLEYAQAPQCGRAPILEFSLGRVREEAEEGDDGVGPGLAMFVGLELVPL